MSTLRLTTESGRFLRTFASVESEALAHALEHYRGNVASAMHGLGLSKTEMYRKLRKHGLLATAEECRERRRAERKAA